MDSVLTGQFAPEAQAIRFSVLGDIKTVKRWLMQENVNHVPHQLAVVTGEQHTKTRPSHESNTRARAPYLMASWIMVMGLTAGRYYSDHVTVTRYNGYAYIQGTNININISIHVSISISLYHISLSSLSLSQPSTINLSMYDAYM